jgi:DNA-binding phage protein
MNAILDNVELQDILTKIEDMEKEMDIDDLLPKALRVKKEDFVAACGNAAKKAEVLKKIDEGIDYVMFQLGPTFKTGGNPFARRVRALSNMLFMANKKVIRVQEHMIDLKNYLHSKA